MRVALVLCVVAISFQKVSHAFLLLFVSVVSLSVCGEKGFGLGSLDGLTWGKGRRGSVPNPLWYLNKTFIVPRR